MYICNMNYNKGDILICSTNELYGQKYNLNIGDRYIILDVIKMSEDRIVLELLHDETKKLVLISDRLFIPLWVYREYQINKIIY